MKKLTLTTLLLIVGFYAFAQQKTPPTTLPNFVFYRATGGQAYTKASLAAGKPTIVVYFDPFCEHCQQEAAWMKAEAAKFANINVLWVSTEEAASIERFSKERLVGPSFTFLKDKDYKFDEYFGYSEVPSILVYGSNGAYIAKYTREVPIAILLTNVK
jgi:peroxiredoxin